MNNSREFLEGAGEGAQAAGGELQSGMRSVQNLETVINEGLRVALQEETPDQSPGESIEWRADLYIRAERGRRR